jgi:hypothetical protein
MCFEHFESVGFTIRLHNCCHGLAAVYQEDDCMTIFVFFDTYVSAYEIKSEVGGVDRMDGITSSSLLQKDQGECISTYCWEFGVEEEKAEQTLQQIRATAAQYAGYVSNLRVMAYKAA